MLSRPNGPAPPFASDISYCMRRYKSQVRKPARSSAMTAAVIHARDLIGSDAAVPVRAAVVRAAARL
jgi:hypothetical protein